MASLTTYREPHHRSVIEWSPALVRAAKIQADAGYLRYAADLCSDLLGDDDRVKGSLRQRSLGLLGLPISFDPSGDKRRKTTITRALEKDFWQCFPEAELSRLVQWGILLGVGLGYLGWEDGGAEHDDRLLPRLHVWHPRWLRYDFTAAQWFVRVNLGQEIPITPGDGQWILYLPYGESTPWAEGTWRPCALWSLLKSYAKRDWGRQSEIAGGIRTADVPEGAKKSDRAELAADLANLGREGVVVPPAGYKIDIIQAAANTWETFRAQLDVANAGIATANLGQNLTSGTEGQSGLGGGGAAKGHGDILQSLKEFDGESLATTLHDQGLVHWTEQNFGARSTTPWAEWDTSPPEDKKAKAETTKTAADALNVLLGNRVRVDVAAYAEEYEIPLLPGEPLEVPKLAPAPTPPQAPGAGSPAPAAPPAGGEAAAAAGEGEQTPGELPSPPGAAAKLEQPAAPAGVMVALFLPPALAAELVLPGGEPAEALHVTLAYLGRAEELTLAQQGLAREVCQEVADDWGTMLGQVGGLGRFAGSLTSDGLDVLYASVDCPGLSRLREDLCQRLEASGILVSQMHGFTPHCTLLYLPADSPSPLSRLASRRVTFETLTLAVGAGREDFPLRQRELVQHVAL